MAINDQIRKYHSSLKQYSEKGAIRKTAKKFAILLSEAKQIVEGDEPAFEPKTQSPREKYRMPPGDLPNGPEDPWEAAKELADMFGVDHKHMFNFLSKYGTKTESKKRKRK